LKERGLYFAFLNDAKQFPERRKGKHVKTALLNMASPTGAIMALIHWGNAEYKKWQDEYHKYINFYNQLDKSTKDNSYEIQLTENQPDTDCCIPGGNHCRFCTNDR
jgi:hypothetical protein